MSLHAIWLIDCNYPGCPRTYLGDADQTRTEVGAKAVDAGWTHAAGMHHCPTHSAPTREIEAVEPLAFGPADDEHALPHTSAQLTGEPRGE